jgi:hypothetical protein
MDSSNSTGTWIKAYLEWMNEGIDVAWQDSSARGSVEEQGADAGEEFVGAYLDWIDRPRPAGARDSLAGNPGRAGDSLGSLDRFREAILLVALHTEFDCMQIVRRVLEAGDATPRTAELAMDALRQAERLLDDERCAWRALSELRTSDVLPSRIASQAEFPEDWPYALDAVVADVRALTGKVMALQAH